MSNEKLTKDELQHLSYAFKEGYIDGMWMATTDNRQKRDFLERCDAYESYPSRSCYEEW